MNYLNKIMKIPPLNAFGNIKAGFSVDPTFTPLIYGIMSTTPTSYCE
jgi:hypothetical protein